MQILGEIGRRRKLEMGHVKPEMLNDLKSELDSIRKFEGIREKSFAVFYFKLNPFLHFHEKDGKRWADVKSGDTFQRVDIDFDGTAADRKKFLRTIREAYQAIDTGRRSL